MHLDSLYRIVFHAARDWPETRAMLDVNRDDDAGMAEQRQRELDMLLSDRFRIAVRDVRLVTYRDLNSNRQSGRLGSACVQCLVP